MKPGGSSSTAREIAKVVRFVVVGAFNTAIGYGVILAFLLLGAGDYLANALGFAVGIPIAYTLHRRFTFKVTENPSRIELVQFALVFFVAYGANVGVVAAGRRLGYVENPAVQLVAIICYAAVLYILNRLVVFREAGTVSDPQD